jgi:serine/threonine-protein kinase
MLRQALEHRREVPLEVVIAIAIGILNGLHYLHEQLDVVHRDISPSNVMVGCDGSVKIIDFGIALWHSARIGAKREGIGGGKPSYMSPEQCLNWPLDRRTDIYSTAVLIWELSVVDKLFCGRDEKEVMDRIVAGDVMPPSVMRVDYPAELEQIVMRGLARHRNARFATAEEMRESLDAFAHKLRIDFSTTRVSQYLTTVLGLVEAT